MNGKINQQRSRPGESERISFLGYGQRAEKHLEILPIGVNGLAVVSPSDDVEESAWKINAWFARHGGRKGQ